MRNELEEGEMSKVNILERALFGYGPAVALGLMGMHYHSSMFFVSGAFWLTGVIIADLTYSR